MFKGLTAVLIMRHFGAELGAGRRSRGISRSSLSGLVEVQRRQRRRNLYRRAHWTLLACRFGLLHGLARRCRRHSLFLACRSHRQRRHAVGSLVLQPPNFAVLFLFLTILLWIMHRANIVRLLDGTEGKIGAKAATSD